MTKASPNPVSYRPNLIKLLISFSPKEINEFDKFVRSPFFNNQRTLVRLYEELKKYYPDFNHADFSKEKLFSSVNPGQEYNDALLRKYCSNLCRLAEEFLSLTEYKSDSERRNLYLLKQFDKRHLNEFYERLFNHSRECISKQHSISYECFLNMHLLNESDLIHHIKTNSFDLLPGDLKSSHNYLIIHLILITVIYNNILLVNRKSFKDSEISVYAEEFLKYFDFEGFCEKLDKGNIKLKKFVELCRYDLMLSDDSYNKENLSKMKSLVSENADSLNDNLFYTFLSHLNVFYLFNIQNGDDSYDPELFENYKLMIDKGVYKSGNSKFINYSEYRTILGVALKLKKFSWAEDFINEYGTGYKLINKSDYIKYSNAFLKFEKNEFEPALELLSKIKLNDFFLKLDVNVLNMMIYFELNYFDSAMSTAENFRRYMKENDLLSAEVKTSHLNFINSYKSILKFRESNNNIFDLGKLKKEIEDFSIVRRKKWLLEKIDELVNRKSGK